MVVVGVVVVVVVVVVEWIGGELVIVRASCFFADRSFFDVGGGPTAHYGTKPGHFETLKIHFPTSEGVSEVSERANE